MPSQHLYETQINDFADIGDRLGRWHRHAPSVIVTAINRMLRDRKRGLSKDVREEINLKAASVNRRIRTRRAKRGGTPVGEIILKERRPPNLTSFAGARATQRKGVVARVRKSEPIETHPHSFIAQGLHGAGKLAFRRRDYFGQPGQGASRYPLVSEVGPSPIGLMMGKPGFAEDQQDKAAEHMQKSIDDAIRAFLARRSGR